MRKWIITLAILPATGALSGCGTFCNLVWWAPFEGGMRPYGGVRAEYGVAKEAVGDWVSGPTERRAIACGIFALLAIDMPLCAVADTITLPITLPSLFGVYELRLPHLESADSGGNAANPTSPMPSVAPQQPNDSINEANFSKIRRGMTQQQVNDVLGRSPDKIQEEPPAVR